ncbi:MAG: hypothetical protein J6W17_04220, partial [Campylobacter sp.]|nr:hypothetical protein [Campylobacter sp.]
GVRVIATLVLRSAPFPLNNPHTLHASIVANLEKSLQLFSKFGFMENLLRKFLYCIYRFKISSYHQTLPKFAKFCQKLNFYIKNLDINALNIV